VCAYAFCDAGRPHAQDYIFFGLFETSGESESLQNLNILMLIHCLTFGDVYVVNSPLHVRKKIIMTFTLERI